MAIHEDPASQHHRSGDRRRRNRFRGRSLARNTGMKLSVVHAGTFKLDGGAMFGVVPKSIWQKANPPDASNLCTWAMRCLLIEDGDRRILVDTGMGKKQDPKFFGYYHPDNPDALEQSLGKLGSGF